LLLRRAYVLKIDHFRALVELQSIIIIRGNLSYIGNKLPINKLFLIT
jgi:hypothetical protein